MVGKVIAVLVAGLMMTPAMAEDLLAPAAKQRLDAVLTTIARDNNLPSVAVLAAIPGHGRYLFVGGVADLATQTPRHADQPFRIASLTKTFVATAVLQLVDRGSLSTSDPIAKWFPGFPNADTITIDDLLRMRSGIVSPSDTAILESIYDHPTAPAPSLAQAMAVSAGLRAQFKPPGAEGVYSDLGYDIIGDIVAKVTGADVGRFITDNIIASLGLRQTTYPTDDQLPGGLHGYGWNAATKQFDDKTAFNPAIGGPSGAMISSLDDLERYVRVLCVGGLLAPDTQRARMQGQALSGTTTQYGEGVITGPGACGHSGTTPGFSTDMYYFADLDATMIISVTRLDRDNALQTIPLQKPVHDALVEATKAR